MQRKNNHPIAGTKLWFIPHEMPLPGAPDVQLQRLAEAPCCGELNRVLPARGEIQQYELEVIPLQSGSATSLTTVHSEDCYYTEQAARHALARRIKECVKRLDFEVARHERDIARAKALLEALALFCRETL